MTNKIKNTSYLCEYQYDVTVLIPVYNAENFIENTIDSVLNNIVTHTTFEILLINDGSTDNSDTLCQNYASTHEQIKYYYHDNRGVSYTRNRGLDLAQGKYIMFLDADDLIEKHTIESIFDSFETYENEADILTYPLYRKIQNKIMPHVRNYTFKKKGATQLYNIYEFPFINQSTMNIVVKNLTQNEKVYFDESLHYAEDAFFNTQMILKQQNIIYSQKGKYYYNLGHDSAVDHYKSPVNIKDMLLTYFEKLIATGIDSTGEVPQYIQGLILYELNWRFLQNTLFPYHLTDTAYNHWMTRMKKIFTYIDISTIMAKPIMDYYHKIFFIQTFKTQINCEYDDHGEIMFTADDTKIGDYANLTLVFNKIKIENNYLHVTGYIKAPLLDMVDEVRLKVTGTTDTQYITLTESPSSYYKTRMKIASFKAFDFYLPIDQAAQFKFNVIIDGHTIDTHHWFDRNVIFKTFIGSKYVITETKIISFESNPFTIQIAEKSHHNKLAKRILKYQKKLMVRNGQKTLATFEKIKKYLKPLMQKQKIWLYNDRVGVLDNAHAQFQHDLKKKDGIKRYYIIREEDKGNSGFPTENIVVYGTLKHKILYYFATLILTSFKEFTEYSPLSYRANNLFYAEMTNKIVYLQHGVLNAHTPWLYGKHVTNFDKFLISSPFEKQNLLNNYGYSSTDLLESGMPRLDGIKAQHKKKKILLAPSWRKSLINEATGLNRTINTKAFVESDFYAGINAILNSSTLNNVLRQYGYTLDLKMHPIFMECASLFETELSNINVLSADDAFELNDYQLFITDFSSYMFDFIKAKTKIAFFFPDYDYFLSGNHVYNKLDFDVSQFSGILRTSDELVAYIETEINKNFAMPAHTYDLYNDFYYKYDNYKLDLYHKLVNM
ncbi:bifunctional glycosyltransferase family 2 protein/CDP-glycerol:glycerophosphate glycerophosphotransferase [Staphylococcus arlettae]|uniref:bifunctional glycosyltransferase/CDP-glycerol:glycerophosphate glycerophosphotransferase n=1 Tax=Staphylococcus arlettae TaxID=29378 RepID=UPI001E4E0C23|nr:glycosyltransferase [Staphylococcus arlettae]MCD8841710.1 bifunctional glycosyltransferase family 2 protein/CDP-glycerol:glycerophosphate glycerophosphotransferase [Staphylococcus arlettae]